MIAPLFPLHCSPAALAEVAFTSHSVLVPDALYLGDNGRCFCGSHAGATASATGRDLSGQPVYRLTPDDIAYATRELGAALVCETCKSQGARK